MEHPRPNFPRADGPLAKATAKIMELAYMIQLRERPVERPQAIYHFTDASGVIGILSSGEIWTSAITGLNDSSEVAYGENTALMMAANVEDSLLRDELVNRLFSSNDRLLDVPYPDQAAYVASFCGLEASAALWLHYGRQGIGFALGFDPERFTLPAGVLLSPVVYDPSQQHALFDELLRQTRQSIEEYDGSADRAYVRQFLCQIATDVIREVLSPHLKNPVFRDEQEWRVLVFQQRRKASVQSRFDVQFRESQNRIIPYLRLPVELSALTEIVVGHSCPIRDGDGTLASLWREKVGDTPVIRRSTVPVRP